MKRLLFILLVLLSAVSASAQPRPRWGAKNYNFYPFNGIRIDSLFTLPDTSYADAPDGSLGFEDGDVFVKDTTWKLIVKDNASSTIWGGIGGSISAQSDLIALLNAKVPKTTTLTINGIAQDLSTDRDWGPFVTPDELDALRDTVVSIQTYTNDLTFSDGLHQAGNNVVALHDEAHWNANKFQGRFVATTTPLNGQVYAWDSVSATWKPTTISAGIGGSTPTLANDQIAFGRNNLMTGSDSLSWGGSILTIKGSFSALYYAKATTTGRAGLTFFNNNVNYGQISTSGVINGNITGAAIGDIQYRSENTNHDFSVNQGTSILVKFGKDSIITFNGVANYGANYGSLYTARSLVDKNYVDSSISALGGGGGSSTFAKIYSSVSNVSTSGTTETDAYSFTIPANTLATDGDQIKYELVTENFTAGQAHTIRFYVDGTGLGGDTEYVNGEVITRVIVTRTSSTTADIELQMWGLSDTYGVPNVVFATGLDWTSNMATKFTMQAPSSGSITSHHVSVNKEVQ